MVDLLLMSSLQEVQVALGHFQESQANLRRDLPEAYVDPLAAVEYCERALPRLYLSIATSAVVIENWIKSQGNGPFGTLMFEGPEALLADLDGMISAVRSPLPGIYIRLYAVLALSPLLLDTPSINRIAVEDFLMGCYKDMMRLWVRWAPLDAARRPELADLVLAPLRSLAVLAETEDSPLAVDAENALRWLVESGDPVAQEIIFSGIVKIFPAPWIAQWLPAFLSAVQSFKPEVNRYACLNHLIKRILSEETENIDEIWEETEAALQSVHLNTESQLISIAELFLEPLSHTDDFSTLNSVFSFLDERISDKTGNESWSSLLSEMTKRTTNVETLLGSDAFVKCICRNTIIDLETTVHLISRTNPETKIEVIQQLVSSVFRRPFIEKHERKFLESVNSIQIIPTESASELFSALSGLAKRDAEDLSVCFYARTLGKLVDDESVLDLFRDLKINGVDTSNPDLQRLFSKDAPIYQFILLTLDQLESYKSKRDDSGLYHCFSKAILACEKSFDSSSLQHQSLSEITASLKDEQISSLLRPQDLEVLLTNLLRIANRQLDTRLRADSLLDLLQVAAGRRSLSPDLSRSLLSHGFQSIRSLSQPRDQVSQLIFLDVATRMFAEQAEALVRLAEDLNGHFWGLRERLSPDCLPQYHQLWVKWVEVVPTSKLQDLEDTEEPALAIPALDEEPEPEELGPPETEFVQQESADLTEDISKEFSDGPSALSKALANIDLDEDY